MEVMFIKAKGTFDLNLIDLTKINTEKIPKNLGLMASIQFVDELPKVKEFLESKGFECEIGGQILGCRVEKAAAIKKKVDAFLYIGDGHFHPIALENLEKPIYLTDGSQMGGHNKKRIVGLKKFLMSEKIGVLISLKHGQHNLDWAENLEKFYPEKNFYFFVGDTMDYSQLENFPFVQAWVNTACNRLTDDLPFANYEDIIAMRNGKVIGESKDKKIEVLN